MKNWRSEVRSIKARLSMFYLGLAFLVFHFGMQQFIKTSREFVFQKYGFWSILNETPYVHFSILIAAILTFLCVVAAQFFEMQLIRIFIAILMFVFEECYNSNGLETHLFQFWIWACVAWAVRSIVLLFYGLSGVWKFYGLIEQVFASKPHILTLSGLSYH